MKKVLLFLCCFFLIQLSVEGSSRWYVKADATGANNGTSWTNAYNDLQSALAAAIAGDEIWVAAGTYKPTGTLDRTISFELINGVSIYGGFNGSETVLSQRNWATNHTILSGDIGIENDPSDNSYHVIRDGYVLDGFTIMWGNANGDQPLDQSGGGMLNYNSSPSLNNCIFTGNSAIFGGGMANSYYTYPTLTNCNFSNNSAEYGGGLYNLHSSFVVANNCSFAGNTAIMRGGGVDNIDSPTSISGCNFYGNYAKSGGGIYHDRSSMSVTNCYFFGNSALSGGGIASSSAISVTNSIFLVNFADNNGAGMSANGSVTNCIFLGNIAGGNGGGISCSASTLVNCSFSGNSAHSGGGISSGSATSVTNCILWGNSSEIYGNLLSVNYSIVKGGYSGTGNKNMDPLFVSQPSVGIDSSGDLHLQAGSPAIDAGVITGAPLFDIDGNDRPNGAGFDMGAYESQWPSDACSNGNILYVNTNATGANNGNSWTNAFTDLQSALNNTCPGVTEIWVAAGTYKPSYSGDPTLSFVLTNDMALYGGFNGTETQRSQRNWVDNETILSGNLSGQVFSYHVVYCSNVNSGAIIDGFTIMDGMANNNQSQIDSKGGGLYNINGSLTISNCLFRYNFGMDGGAIYNGGSESSLVITNSTFEFNGLGYIPNYGTYWSEGGAIYNESYTSSVIENCVFKNNTGTRGGAINYFWGGQHAVSNSVFLKNEAWEGGAAIISTSDDLSIMNCTFDENLVRSSHSLDYAGSAIWGSFKIAFGCNFINNRFNTIALEGDESEITNCRFSNNFRGIFSIYDTDISVTNCIFYNNVQGVNKTYTNGSIFTLTNCSFYGNQWPAYPGTGGAIINYSSSPIITNCIFWGNENDFINDANSSPEVSYSIIQSGYPGVGNLTADPLFADAAVGDLHLLTCSPAINSGNNFVNNTLIDLDGNPRKFDNIDMGAFESQVLSPPILTCYRDQDNDSFGNLTLSQSFCSVCGPGYVLDNSDCDDTDASVYYGAIEICDGKDNNCNGQIDEPGAIGSSWGSSNVGTGSNGGANQSCSPDNVPTYNVSAQGYSTPTDDVTHTVFQQLCGNASITVRVASVSSGGWAGITMRESLEGGSKMVALKTQLSNFGIREARNATNGPKQTQIFPATLLLEWLRITRNGNTFQYFISHNGTNWQLVGTVNITMGSCLYMGMFAESINVNTTTTASFSNVSISEGVLPLAGTMDNQLADQFITKQHDFNLYPNPTSGVVNIDLKEYLGDEVRIEAYSLIGQLVYFVEIDKVQTAVTKLDLSVYPNGTYLIRVHTDGQPDTTKWVKLLMPH